MTVHQICDTYVGDLAALDPMNATYLGIAGHDESMPRTSRRTATAPAPTPAPAPCARWPARNPPTTPRR